MGSLTAAPSAIQWDDQSLIRTIKETVCKGATDSQFRMFIEVCKATGLNPWLREIWFVPAVGVMAGRDGYLRVANEHPQFDGMSTTVERDEKGVPLKATCSVWRKDRNHPITCEAWYSEYRKSSNVWQTYPSAMISKVAEVLALKRSFAINGIVTEEEIGEQKLQAQDAQNEVRDRRIKELSAPTSAQVRELVQPLMEPLAPAVVIELANSLDQAPEPPLMAPDVKKPPKKVQTYMSESAKLKWRQAKLQLNAVRKDNDKFYYDAIAPYKHCTHIPTKEEADMRWKILQSGLAPEGPPKHDLTLEEELRRYERENPKFIDKLGAHGFESVADVIERANGTQTGLLLSELRQK